MAAAKAPVFDPAATVTEAGTVTAALLLERLTMSPPAGAAVVNVTVQVSVPAVANELVEHESALRAAGGVNCTANVLETPLAEAVRVAV